MLIWGEWPEAWRHNLNWRLNVDWSDEVVKLSELQYKTFPPTQSNFGPSIAAISHVTPKGEVTREGAPSRGSQRIERVHHDKWGYETERTDGSVRVGARGGLKRIRAIKEWHRLRRYAGLPDKYFHEVTEGKACVWPLPDVGKLTWERALWAQVKQFADARWLDANYKSPEKVFDGKSFAGLRTAWDRVHSAAPAKQLTGWPYPFITCTASPEPTRRWYRAPYVPFVNEHKNDKLKKGAGKYNTQRGEAILTDQYGPYRPGEEVIAHRWSPPPRVFKSSKAPRPTGKRTKRWAAEVHNNGPVASTVDQRRKEWPDANKQFALISPEPKQVWNREGVVVKRLTTNKPTRCMPRNLSLPKFREDEMISCWPILMPSTHRDCAVLFDRSVTTINPSEPMEVL